MSSCIRRGLLAALVVTVFAGSSQACWYPCGCVCYQPVCWYPCWPCWPCLVFHVSEPVVKIDGPFPTLVRRVRVGEGVIAQFDVPSGIHPGPIDQIEVVKTSGKGGMLYFGWNKYVVHPGLPGGPIRYSIFLSGYQIGDCEVEVRLKYSDNSIHKAQYYFRIYDIYDQRLANQKQDQEIQPQTVAGTGSATIVVDLPEDAKLTFNDDATESTSARRVFTTPDLEDGKEYSYTLKAEIVRDGRTQVVTREVTVRAGEETEVKVEFPSTGVAGR